MSSNQIKDQEKLKSMQRRQFWRLAVGALAMIGLAACGGGGGGGEDDSEFPLRAAYDKINKGITKEEVLEIVGREPEGKADGDWNYSSGIDYLTVWFGFQNDSSVRTVIGVEWETTRRVPALTLKK